MILRMLRSTTWYYVVLRGLRGLREDYEEDYEEDKVDVLTPSKVMFSFRTRNSVRQEKALWEASTSGDLATVKACVSDSRVNVNWRDPELGRSPFYRACGHGRDDIVRFLLTLAEIDVNMPQNEGATPLCVAASQGHEEVIRLLLADPRVQVNVSMETTGGSPLFYACQHGFVGMVARMLRDPRIDINLVTKNGVAPLFIACDFGSPRIVEMLLDDPKIDLSDQGRRHDVPLLYAACEKGRTEVVELLLADPRIDVAMKRADGLTPLWIASQNGHLEAVRRLLASDRDLDPLAKRSDGRDAVGAAQMSTTQETWDWEQPSDAVRRWENCPLIAALITDYLQDPVAVKTRLGKELQAPEKLAGSYFALVVLLSDRFLALRHQEDAGDDRRDMEEVNSARFLAFALRLPFDLQMVLCSVAAASSKTVILSKFSEPAFRFLAKPSTWRC